MAVWPWNGTSYSASTTLLAAASAALGSPCIAASPCDVDAVRAHIVEKLVRGRERRSRRRLPLNLQTAWPLGWLAPRARKSRPHSCRDGTTRMNPGIFATDASSMLRREAPATGGLTLRA